MPKLATVNAQWANLDEALGQLRQELTEVARGITVSAWKHILAASPQYDGRLVVSWTYNLHNPLIEDRSAMAPPREEGVGPYRAGDRPAIDVANALNAGRDLAFRLGDTVWISNGVNHGEGMYAEIAESITFNGVTLRYVNMPAQPITRTSDLLAGRYSGGVNRAQAGQLRRLSIAGGAHAD